VSRRAPITRFTSRCVVLPGDNVDTDRIIPARFLKTTTRTGLGLHAFNDLRYRSDGSPVPDFPLNRPGAAGAEILVAGENFGCGSSREHAVWALQDAGFRAVISVRFADIFRANALANGLVPVELPRAAVDLLTVGRSDGQTVAELTVDLASQAVTLSDGSEFSFTLPPFSRYCLLNGMDEMDFLVNAESDIDSYERARR
jgi:3-isopropylmalate/(R)-2-methylmalate dehydratase small subunit